MPRFATRLAGLILLAVLTSVQAQPQAVETSGTLVVVSASGEVKHANDEAHLTFMIEEQDKDKAAAASRVNQKMKQGMEIVKREDSQALLKTRGYYTYPVYGDEQIQPRQANHPRQPIAWRVGHYLDVTTQNLNGLPKMVATAQRVVELNGLYFGLAESTAKKMEEQRIAVAYRNLTDRIAAIAKVLGRSASDAILDTLDFEGPGAIPQYDARVATMRTAPTEAAKVEEPSFEPGETTLSTHVIGRVRFK